MNWYYHDGQKQIGPMAEAEIAKAAAAGAVHGATQVWKEGTPAWVAAGSSELKQYLSPEPPPMVQMTPPPMQSAATPSAEGLVQPRSPARSVGWMTFWGFIWAGLGQLILGQTTKGIVLMVASAVICFFPGGVFISVIMSVVSAIDANKVAKRLQAGNPVDQWAFFPDRAA
jgi:TM2 domain-containing membrane protein YozV